MSHSLRILIVDDEKPARNNLRFLLNQFDSNQSFELFEANSGQEARSILNTQQIDLIFLDIQMPVEDGFDFLLSIQYTSYAIIFTTAYNQFAIKAFRAGAVDYLLKPIDFTELQEAVTKVNTSKFNSHLQSTENLANNEIKHIQLQIKTGQIFSLRIASKNGFNIIPIADISYLEADSNYTIFHLINLKKVVSAKPLKDYEEMIEGQAFFRIHKSYLINLHQFKYISKTEPSIAEMRDGSNLPIARRKLTSFVETVKKMNNGNIFE
ncbi:MAG: LytR/AlgR family response regulator transcription factor [Bacteroidia bacterium]